MKCLTVVIIALVASVATAEEWKPVTSNLMLTKIGEDCRNGSGLSEEQKEQIIEGVYPDEKEVHDNVLCEMKSLGFFTEEDGLRVDRLFAALTAYGVDANRARDDVVKCSDNNEQGSTKAAWAYRINQCLRKIRYHDVKRKLPKSAYKYANEASQ